MRIPMLLLLSLPTGPLLAQAVAPDQFTGVDRIVAVGDVHGDFKQFVTVLRQAGVIDGKNHWAGGRTHLVQTGDVLDRGPDSRKVMDLLMALETESVRAGGRVHALIGNHEAMNVLGDLRYVSAGEYKAFATRESARLRDKAFAVLADTTRANDAGYPKEWQAEHPLGWVEHRQAFAATGKYGAWIRQHHAVVKIDGFLFLHGGIGPGYLDQSITDINTRVREALTEDDVAPPDIAQDSDGPLWYRGLAQEDEAAVAPHVEQVLASFGVRHVVIGHTLTHASVTPRLGGKVIMIDVGLSAVYGGPAACLIVEGGKPYTLDGGKKLELSLSAP